MTFLNSHWDCDSVHIYFSSCGALFIYLFAPLNIWVSPEDQCITEGVLSSKQDKGLGPHDFRSLKSSRSTACQLVWATLIEHNMGAPDMLRATLSPNLEALLWRESLCQNLLSRPSLFWFCAYMRHIPSALQQTWEPSTHCRRCGKNVWIIQIGAHQYVFASGLMWPWLSLTSRAWVVYRRVTLALCQRGNPNASEISNSSCSKDTTPLRFNRTVTLKTERQTLQLSYVILSHVNYALDGLWF